MADDLSTLADWANPLLQRLDSSAQRQVARALGAALRRSQAKRIAGQLNPDGTPFEPRKTQARARKGKIRREAMFQRLRTVRWLKMQTDSNGVAIGFLGRTARIARVHQEGLPDDVNPGVGPRYTYPSRRLLGLTEADLLLIRNTLIDQLAGR